MSDPGRHVLSGGGGMGALMRAHDWAATPIGAPSSWPQSLRTAVGLLLDSHYPKYIAWGSDFTQMYNDGYRPILGSKKHPHALGRSTRETFAEIWDFIGPMFERVMAGGDATFLQDQILPLDRNGYIEECYFTFCYSAIRDESEGVGGVFVTVTETTARVVGERRLRVLRDLGATASATTTVRAALDSTLQVLAADPEDIPFALLWTLDDDGALQLEGTSGLPAGQPVDAAQWGACDVVASGSALHIRDLVDRAGAFACAPWPEELVDACALPILVQDRVAGVLVSGVSARRRLDADYRDFLGLVGGHIASALASARAHEEEKRRADALAEIDRAKTAFFNNVSHEFRTPLTLMLGPLEEVLDGDALPPKQRASIETVHRNALRQLRLVNTLLDFSRIEAGRMDAAFEPVRLDALTADLASAFRSAIEKAGLSLVLDLEPLDETVHVDVDMWEKIVLNLLSNAFKHTFDGSIRVSLRRDGDHVRLDVSDTGVGIAAEDLPRVFERFHRVKGARARSHEGTGIGLTLVRELVHLLHGEITVQSRAGEGTTFTVRLPRGSVHAPRARNADGAVVRSRTLGALPFVHEALRWLPAGETRPRGEAAPLLPFAAGLRDARILVADDNLDLREYLARLLEPYWHVQTVADGAAALAAARATLPDLVLADVMMPGLDGFELLRELRGAGRTRDIPVVLLSARAGEEARVEGLGAGADDYIVKPFGARELLARVAARLELTRLRNNAARERERLIRELSREREQLSEIIELAPAVIAVLRGPEHVFERCNRRYAELTGGRPLIGRRVRDVFPEIDGQGYLELLDRVYATGQPYVGEEERLMLEHDGRGVEERFVNFVYQPLRSADGAVTGIFAHGVDVTEIVQSRRAAEEANRAKTDFMAMMSHELRTPLNAVMGYLELLRMGIPQPVAPAALAHVERIGASANHLLQLIEEVLTFTRLQAGGLETVATRVPLRSVLAEVRATIEPLAQQKHIDLVIDTGAAPDTIVADARKLRQVLLNLLGNAVKFTERGGVRLEVAAADGVVAFNVIDSGIGMEPGQLEQVFEPFWQADQSRTRQWGGTGLGLAISKRLASLMGGSITATSEPGRGSTFSLRLPVQAGLMADDERRAPLA